jgi:hypothetical protein
MMRIGVKAVAVLQTRGIDGKLQGFSTLTVRDRQSCRWQEVRASKPPIIPPISQDAAGVAGECHHDCGDDQHE